ncbi:MAG: hypothetical protein AABP62_27935 [Planctomycetota bacterium]
MTSPHNLSLIFVGHITTAMLVIWYHAHSSGAVDLLYLPGFSDVRRTQWKSLAFPEPRSVRDCSIAEKTTHFSDSSLTLFGRVGLISKSFPLLEKMARST